MLLSAGALYAQDLSANQKTDGLRWENEIVQLENDGGTDKKLVEFKFRNTSDKPVTILGVSTSCGCTVGRTDKKVYAAGESGVLPIEHKPKPGPGVRQYRIGVRTDENGGTVHDLILRVANTPRVRLDKRVLTWERGEPRIPKEIAVTLKEGDPLKVVGARPENPAVRVEVATGTEANRQILRVTPGGDAASGRIRVQLVTDPPLPPSADSQFFVVLR